MQMIKQFVTENPCYKAGKKITIKGLMLHSVGCPQPSAVVFIGQWNKTNATSCVHGIIDANTGAVYQTLPWDHRGWHCGSSGNNTHIGVEMCEPNSIKYTTGANFVDLDSAKTKAAVLRTYNSAVELFAALCKDYHLDPMKDIVSHREGNAKGIASNHGDPEHLWSKFGLTMNQFRQDVKNKMTPVDEVAQARQIVKQKAGLADATMEYLAAYRWGADLLKKLANAMK